MATKIHKIHSPLYCGLLLSYKKMNYATHRNITNVAASLKLFHEVPYITEWHYLLIKFRCNMYDGFVLWMTADGYCRRVVIMAIMPVSV